MVNYIEIHSGDNVKKLEINPQQLEFVRKVLACTDPIAMKLWCESDLVSAFEDEWNRQPTPVELEVAFNRLDYSVLEDCTDAEWDALRDAVIG